MSELERSRNQRAATLEEAADALVTMATSIKALVDNSYGIHHRSGLDIPWDELLDPEKHAWFDPQYDGAIAILERLGEEAP